MTNTKKTGKQNVITTPEFRVSYPAVFQARAAVAGQEPKFGLCMIYRIAKNPERPNEPIVDITSIKQLVAAVITEKFGPDKAKWPKFGIGPGMLRLPFRDGTETAKKDAPGYGPGTIFINTTSKRQPGVVDQNVQPILNPNDFYGGCWARASITAYYYNSTGNQGIGIGLRNVQKTRDDEPLGNATRPEDDFGTIPVPDAPLGGDAVGGAAAAASSLGDLGV